MSLLRASLWILLLYITLELPRAASADEYKVEDGQSALAGDVVSNPDRYTSRRIHVYGYLGNGRDFSNNSWFMLMPYPELGNASLYDAVVPLTVTLRFRGDLDLSKMSECVGALVGAAGTLETDGRFTVLIVDMDTDPVTSFAGERAKSCN